MVNWQLLTGEMTGKMCCWAHLWPAKFCLVCPGFLLHELNVLLMENFMLICKCLP